MVVQRSRVAGERMDRVRIDLTSQQSMGLHVSEYEEMRDMAREGLDVLRRRSAGAAGGAAGDVGLRRVPASSKLPKLQTGVGSAAPGARRVRRLARKAPWTPEAPMTNTHQAAVAVTGVRKSFGETVALDGVDLTVAEGTIFALSGRTEPARRRSCGSSPCSFSADSGDAQVAGHDIVDDPDGVRASIGVTGQFSAVDELLTGKENLQLMADLNYLDRAAGRARVDELLARFDLVDAARRPASTYSGGMRRRLDLAMTLVGSPRVIFLDEPTTGLDPRSRRQMWDDIRELAAAGVTILLTTQYLDEADELADRIAVLDHGSIVAEGSPDELKRLIPGGHVRLLFADPPTLRAAAALSTAPHPTRSDSSSASPETETSASLRRLLGRLDDARDRGRGALDPQPRPGRRLLRSDR